MNEHETRSTEAVEQQLIDELAAIRQRVAELEALQKSEEGFRGYMDAATEPFSLWDSELNLIWVNRAGLMNLPPGLREKWVPGKNMLDVAPGVKASGRYDEYLEVIKTGESLSLDDTVPPPEYGDTCVTVRAFKAGDCLGMMVIDITERRRAEEELRRYRDHLEELVRERTAELAQANEQLHREISDRTRGEEMLRASEETARALLNAPTDVAALIDSHGVILDANEAMAQRFGRHVDELIGVNGWDLLPPEVAERRKLHFAEVFRSGEPRRFEDERRGTWFDNVVYPVLDAQGKTAKVAVLARDITERKRAEEELRRAHEETAHSQRLLLALSHAAQAVQRARTSEEIFRTVGDEVARLGYHAIIFAPADDQAHLVMPYTTFEPALLRAAKKLTGVSARGYRFPVKPGGSYHQLLAEGETVFTERTVEHIAEMLRTTYGVEVGTVFGDTLTGLRSQTLDDFRAGRLKYLVNVNVLTTGFDAPNIDCVALVRPTMSPGLYYQMAGRGFRLCEGKQDCLILDFGGNILRHGPVDAVHLHPPNGNGNGQAPAKECPRCHEVIAAGYVTCPACGHEFPERRRTRHKAKASMAGILSDEATFSECPVQSVYYSVHTKRGASDGAPKSMRVEYRTGWQQYHSEWVCFEHSGRARERAERWWRRRSDAPVPDTAAKAVALANSGALCETKFIVVRSDPGQKYDRIVAYQLGEKPPFREPGEDDEQHVSAQEAEWALATGEVPY